MIGNSAGRARGNRTAAGAARRNTPRERAQIDPPFEDEDGASSSYQLTVLGERLMTVLAYSCWVVFCMMFALVLASWWELI